MFVDVLVGDDLAVHLGGQIMAGVAAEPVLDAELDPGLRQDALAAAARDLAGGERVSGDHGRRFAQHGRDLLRRELAAVEGAEIGELALGRRRTDPVAEIVLAAGIELDVGRQLVAEFVEEAEQAAEMIVMAVADDQRVEFRRIDADQFHVVQQHFGRIAVVQHQRALASRGLQFQPQRQAPFIMQRLAEIGASRRRRDRDAIGLLGAEELVVAGIDQHPDRQFVHRRHRDRCGAGDLDAGKRVRGCSARRMPRWP